MKRKVNKGRLFRNCVLVVLVLGSVGLYFSNRYIKTKGFGNLSDFITNYRTNKKLVSEAETKVMQLLIKERDYQFLERKREEALARGIQVNIGDNYVKCKVVLNGDTTKGEIRLKGHMTDHLEGDKWSFRVKTKKEVMGMYRFSLQNPGTRNYVYEWIYHQLLKYEGVIHLKYDFLRLKLNDKDLGIYAVEEHFGQHILRDNNRPKGAILRWNPELYWESRLDEIDGNYLDEAYSSYSSSFPEAYDKGVVKKDEELVETYLAGAKMLEAFRRGDKTTSEVFDIEKMARFHAVIDLVGGYHSLDWSDVKFYYNSESKKIEPVGYESFSVRETAKIAGQRIPEDYATAGFNYHDRLFADPKFFKAYIKNLERICSADYFDKFTATIEKELNLKRGTLAEEFAYIKFSYQPYYDNIELIQHNLELPKAFHAFYEGQQDSTLAIAVTPVSDFPIKIQELEINGKKEVKIAEKFILPPKARNTYANYYNLKFKLPSTYKKQIKTLRIKAKILGASSSFYVEVSMLPSYQLNIEKDTLNATGVSTEKIVWINDSTATLPLNSDSVNGRIEIPKGKTLLIANKNKLHFSENAQLIGEGEIQLIGNSETALIITADKAIHAPIFLKGGSLLAINTNFVGMDSPFLRGDKGKVNLQTCNLAAITTDFIQAEKTAVTLTNCASGSLNTLGIFDRCELRIKNFVGNKGTKFLTAYGCDVEMYFSHFSDYEQLADLNYSTNFSTWDSSFKNIALMGQLNNNSRFECFSGTITGVEKGFEIDLDTKLLGNSTYLLYRTQADINQQEERKKG